jgi:hypothetical protein
VGCDADQEIESSMQLFVATCSSLIQRLTLPFNLQQAPFAASLVDVTTAAMLQFVTKAACQNSRTLTRILRPAIVTKRWHRHEYEVTSRRPAAIGLLPAREIAGGRLQFVAIEMPPNQQLQQGPNLQQGLFHFATNCYNLQQKAM